MEEDTLLSLDIFLEEYGFEKDLSNKEKIKILKQIIVTVGVGKDLEELRFSNNKEKEIDKDKEYFNKINNLDLIQMQAQGYIIRIKRLERENRKLKRKQSLQKIMKAFNK